MPGYIKLFRDIRDHWIWKDPVRFQRWIDILLSVNHADNKVNIGNHIYDCRRGQSLRSLESWAKRWNTTKKTVRCFFILLEEDSMLVYEPLQNTTRITVCNYDRYQGEGNGKETVRKRNGNSRETDATPKQEIKNNKEEYNTSRIPFSTFWDAYDKKVGSKKNSEHLWQKLPLETQQTIIKTLPAFKSTIPDKKFQPYPEKYLKAERWNDEISAKESVYNPETGKWGEKNNGGINYGAIM
jgi:hypothetical protein